MDAKKLMKSAISLELYHRDRLTEACKKHPVCVACIREWLDELRECADLYEAALDMRDEANKKTEEEEKDDAIRD